MKIIQTNILSLNGVTTDFQSIVYDVDMIFKDFKNAMVDNLDVSKKITNSTMQGVGKKLKFIIVNIDIDCKETDIEHFSIVYDDNNGGKITSYFYKTQDI